MIHLWFVWLWEGIANQGFRRSEGGKKAGD
jgi:hypothetical protein